MILLTGVMVALYSGYATPSETAGLGAIMSLAIIAVIYRVVTVLGFFLPPVSIILMTAPIVLPPLKAAGFDLIWFGIVMTIVMETGLTHPPVGLNLFIIKNIAPDIAIGDIIRGVMPFVAIMIATVALLCFVPDIAMWLPSMV